MIVWICINTIVFIDKTNIAIHIDVLSTWFQSIHASIHIDKSFF